MRYETIPQQEENFTATSFVKPGREVYCAEKLGGWEHTFGVASAARASRSLIVVGTFDKILVKSLVGAWVKANTGLQDGMSDLYYNELKISLDPSGVPKWDCNIVYSYVKFFETSYTVSFSTTAGSAHINQSLSSKAHPIAPFTYRPHYGMIGLNASGEYEGVDIKTPTLQMTISENRPAKDVDMAFVKKISDMTAKTNDAEWFKFPPGCVLYEGCTGELVQYDSQITIDQTYYYKLSHTFSFSSALRYEFYNELGQKTGELYKPGWDYMWIEQYKKMSEEGKQILIPKQMMVEQVYERGDFSKVISLHGSILDPDYTYVPPIAQE